MTVDSSNAVVTGGASGLGAATARLLAARGMHVFLLDLDEKRGSSLAKEIGGTFIRTNVADAGSVAEAIATAGANGPLRVAVNCAGIAPAIKTVSRDGAPHDPEALARTISVNLIGTFHVLSQAAASMCANTPEEDGQRGLIVNTASIAAFDGQMGQIAYAASKAGVAGMTLPAARDLAQFGIRVVTIAPGLFMTPLLEGLPEAARKSLGQQVPFPSRLGDPAEYAALVGAIVENSMLNGEVIRLDGALRMAPR